MVMRSAGTSPPTNCWEADMATYQVGETAPYMAANGHLMVAPLYVSDRHPDAEPFKISAYAYCADSCRACGAGDNPDWYCGESWDGDY
jgi:hypothetical protein